MNPSNTLQIERPIHLNQLTCLHVQCSDFTLPLHNPQTPSWPTSAAWNCWSASHGRLVLWKSFSTLHLCGLCSPKTMNEWFSRPSRESAMPYPCRKCSCPPWTLHHLRQGNQSPLISMYKQTNTASLTNKTARIRGVDNAPSQISGGHRLQIIVPMQHIHVRCMVQFGDTISQAVVTIYNGTLRAARQIHRFEVNTIRLWLQRCLPFTHHAPVYAMTLIITHLSHTNAMRPLIARLICARLIVARRSNVLVFKDTPAIAVCAPAHHTQKYWNCFEHAAAVVVVAARKEAFAAITNRSDFQWNSIQNLSLKVDYRVFGAEFFHSLLSLALSPPHKCIAVELFLLLIIIRWHANR